MQPRIGITVDTQDRSPASNKYLSNMAYSRAVAAAGGLPLLLPHEPEMADAYVELCDGLILSGGDDAIMEPFGEPTHPAAEPMHPRRQASELALLAAIDRRREKPVLGICLGMQLMALHHGGKLHQHLPDVMPTAADHAENRRHPIVYRVRDSHLPVAEEQVVSYHHQGVAAAGKLRTLATAPDGLIEAVDNPDRPFYLGVQWHPERGGEGILSWGLIARLVHAARARQG